MGKTKTRILLFLFVVTAFIGPFVAIVIIEKVKQNEKLLREQKEVALVQSEAIAARYQYYLDVNDRKTNLKQAMDESKAQYEQLLKEQPNLIKANETTVTQTVIKPVPTEKKVTQKVATPSSAKAAKPKSSAKTKSS